MTSGYWGFVISMKKKSVFNWVLAILAYEMAFYEKEEKIIDDAIEISKFIIDIVSFPIPKDIAVFDIIIGGEKFYDLFEMATRKENKFVIFWDNKYYSHENLFEKFFSLFNDKLLIKIHNEYNDKLSYYGFENLNYFINICNLKVLYLMKGQNKFILPTNM